MDKKNKKDPDYKKINKNVLIIMDDWISSGVPLNTG